MPLEGLELGVFQREGAFNGRLKKRNLLTQLAWQRHLREDSVCSKRPQEGESSR